MGQFDQPLFDAGFASGLVYYEDQYPGQDPTARIILTVTVAGLHTVPAIVDTDAPWCLLDADILAEIEPEQLDSLLTERLAVRGVSYQSRLTRLMVSLRADVGEDVDLEATVFVPILQPGETWNMPNFIGLQRLLSRIRFAVDPAENIFYFGPA